MGANFVGGPSARVLGPLAACYSVTVTQDSLIYVVLAVAGPVAAVATENPQMIFEGGAASALGAVGLVLWKLANAATAHLKAVEIHRDLQVKEWGREAEHRTAELEHWRTVSGQQ